MSLAWRIASTASWSLALLALVLVQPLLFVLLVLLRPIDPERRVVARVFRSMGRIIVGLQPWVRVRIDRRWKGRLPQPCVIVSNHESDADVYVSGYLAWYGWDAKYLAKDTLYDLPVMGWGMRMAGDIPVVRDDRRSRVKAMIACRRWLERGVPVFFFPEGTRSRTGEMAAFKDGAFRLAIESGVPIQPIALAGTRDALPPGAFLLRPARITLRILEPIPVDGLVAADAGPLAERVRALVLAERDEMRRAHAG